MTKLGGGLFSAVPSLPDEQVVVSYLANQTQHAARAVGGKLLLTTHRFVFVPHRFDAVTGGRVWIMPRADVLSVGIQSRGGDTFGGGLRERLRLDTNYGAALFVVNKLQQVRDEIAGHLGLR